MSEPMKHQRCRCGETKSKNRFAPQLVGVDGAICIKSKCKPRKTGGRDIVAEYRERRRYGRRA